MAVEYIKRNVAIESMSADNLLRHFDSVNDVIENRFHRAAERILAGISASDVVEVVRCRDCEYWRGENNYCKGLGIDFGENGYCAFGKRKEDS